VGAEPRTDLEQLELHLVQLAEAIQHLFAAPTVTATALSRVADLVRWTRFYVNVSLAFARQVHPLRDEAWGAARYSSETAARELLVAFRDTSKALTASRLDVVELRNLSARVEGLGHVVDGWRDAVS
jgi:hypothetical protein